MRTKDQLSTLLRGRLTSPVWTGLKRALIGNELIEFGANALELNDAAYEVLYNDMYIDTASLKGCIYISRSFEVPFFDFKPSFIKIKMPVDGGIVYPPFSIVMTAGTVRFTNIEYVKGSTDAQTISNVTLYQGNVVVATNSFEDAPALGFLNVTPVNAQVYYNGDAFGLTEKYVKLTRTVIPTSVYGYVLDEDIYRPVVLRTPINKDPEVWSFAMMKGYDNITNFHFGNTENGKPLGSERVFIYYLDCTFNKQNNASYTFSRAGESATLFPADSILSEYSGESESAVQRATSLRAELVKNSVAATLSQVRSYINSFPEVLDSNPTKDKAVVNNVITYVKPININETDFSDIEEQLRLYAEIVTTYEVIRGTPTYLDVLLTALSPVTGNSKNQILTRLQQELSYQSLAYKSEVGVSLLSAIAAEYTSAGVTVDLILKLSYTGDFKTNLGIRPLINTLKITVGSTLVGWDSFGAVFGFNTSSSFSFGINTFKIGDMVYTQTTPDRDIPFTFVGFNPSRQAQLNSNAIDIQGIVNVLVEKDFFVVSYPDLTYRVYPLSREFFDGQGSVLQSTSVSVLPVYPSAGFQTSAQSYDILDNSLFIGDVIYHFHKYTTGDFIGSYIEVYKMSPDKTTWGLVSREFLSADQLTPLGFFTYETIIGFVSKDADELIGFAWDIDTAQALSVRPMNVAALNTKLNAASIASLTVESIFGGVNFQSVVSKVGSDYTASKISGAVISLSVSSGILTFAGDFTTDLTSTTPIKILGDTIAGVYYKNDSSLRYKATTEYVINNSTPVPRLSQIGSIAYESNELQITDSTSLAGGVITFSLAESLSRLDDSIFPVINSITWNV